MNLEKAQQEAWKEMIQNSLPVAQGKIEKFERDMAEDYSKYLIESRAAAMKTAELSRTVCVA